MADERPELDEDRRRIAAQVGTVESLIDKLLSFREASVSCIHIEASLEAGRGLGDFRPRRRR